MEIREPRYKVGDKMNFTNHPGIFEVVEMINFNFCINDYFYKVKHMDFGEIFITNEANLEPYVEKPKTVWDLQKGDECYFATVVGHIFSGTWDNWDAQIENRKLGNVFLTRKEAEYELERIKIETEMLRLGGRREFKNGKNNYYIVCDFDTHYSIVVFNNKTDGFAPMTIYFDSAKECRNAIETIGEYRIKRYIFKLGISCNEN